MNPLYTASLALACACAFSTAAAQPSPAAPAWPSDALREAYLACDRAATQAVLPAPAIVRCAEIADALLARDFDGDFERMLAWWRAEKSRAALLAGRAAPVR